MITNILDDFNIEADFWADPQMRILFKEEYDSGVPSHTMWGLLLDTHPKSKLADLDPISRRTIIAQDFLADISFKWNEYENTITKMKKVVLTRAERLLKNWETKLEERDYFLDNTPYNEDNFDLLEKAMKETYKMWENYEKVLNRFQKEDEGATFGNLQESASERGDI